MTMQKSEVIAKVEELMTDIQIVNNNLEHLMSAVEFLCAVKDKSVPIRLKVNHATGKLLDKNYAGNEILQLSDKNKTLFMEEKGYFTERAKQNISNLFYIFTEYYL